MEIRSAAPADGHAFLSLVQALAEYEKLPPPDAEARQRLLDDAFGDAPRYELRLAVLDDRVVAYAAFFATYSTFLARPSLYLEDLFVHPDARRRGIATALLADLRGLAEQRGCGRFEWTVLDWNKNAQELYRKVGAELLGEWRLCRTVL